MLAVLAGGLRGGAPLRDILARSTRNNSQLHSDATHSQSVAPYIQPCATDALFWRDIGRRRQVLILRNPIGRSQILLPHRFGRSGRVRQTCKEFAAATSSLRRASDQTRKGASARNMSLRALRALLHCETYSREALATTHNCTVTQHTRNQSHPTYNPARQTPSFGGTSAGGGRS